MVNSNYVAVMSMSQNALGNAGGYSIGIPVNDSITDYTVTGFRALGHVGNATDRTSPPVVNILVFGRD